MNTIAAGFIAIGALFDIAVWYHVKNLKVYDEKLPDGTEMKDLDGLMKSENNEKQPEK